MKIIIYGSHYGTAKLYAEELSKETNIKAENYENIKSIDEYDTIIYIGATYTPYNVGDEVTIGEESFYVIEASDENTEMVTLLAKYVLDASTTKQTNADIDCVFSTNNYWSGETLPSSSPYFNLNDYPAVKNETVSAVYRANKYATEELGAESGRLLTYEEANALKDSIPDIIWVTYGNSKYYWLGSALDAYYVWRVHGNYRYFSYDYYADSTAGGVRPVIKISKSKI